MWLEMVFIRFPSFMKWLVKWPMVKMRDTRGNAKRNLKHGTNTWQKRRYLNIIKSRIFCYFSGVCFESKAIISPKVNTK